MTDLQAGVGPVVVGALLAGDAPGRAALTLVPEAHSPLLGLLEDLDLRLSHWRAHMMETVNERGVERGGMGKWGGDGNAGESVPK